jgi:pyruvate/2-oxoglutarate dehydrogenase complex dihydrolipoamide acyltransferase (E2) component
MTRANAIGNYQKRPFPRHRDLLGNLASLSPKYPIQVLLEVDVTKGRACLRQYKERTGDTLSFTAWLIKCISQAVSEYKQVQAYKKGRTLIIFDDVDVGFAIERPGEQKTGGLVLGAIVRKANEKTVVQVNQEIRTAQSERMVHGTILGEKEEARLAGFFQSLPGVVRRLAVWWYRRDPFLRKRTQGTVGMTSVGNVLGATSGMYGFPITSGPFPCYFGVGSISRKPVVQGNDQIEIREMLPMCAMFDHEVVDGADIARFLGRLGELLKDAYGLAERDTISKNLGGNHPNQAQAFSQR